MIKKFKNSKIKIKNSKEKGFTLVEVLATLAIIAIIFSVSYVVYINLINKSKDTSDELTLNSLKEAAELFASEGQFEWINKYNGTEEAGDYTCVTVNDLINNGYFNEDVLKNDTFVKQGITANSYFNITRGENKSIESIDISPEDDFNKCMLKNLKLNIEADSYADALVLKIKDYNPDNTYSLIMEDGSKKNCENDKCILENLKSETKYKIKVVASKAEETLSILEVSLITKIMPEPIITISKSDYLTIDYNDNGNIYNKSALTYYFNSDIDLYSVNYTFSSGVSVSTDSIKTNYNYQLKKCNDNNLNSATCITNVNKVDKTINYLSDSNKVRLYFSDSENTKKIKAYMKIGDNIGQSTGEFKNYSYPKPVCQIKISSGTRGNLISGSSYWYRSNIGLQLTASISSGDSFKYGFTTSSTVTYSKTYTGSSTLTTSATQSSDTKGQTWYGYVIGKYDRSNSCKITVYKDSTAPTCSVSKSNTGSTSGVTATFSCSDKHSGVSSCVSTKSGLKSSRTYTIKDKAGNSGTCKVSVSSTTQYRYIQKLSKAKTCTKSCCGYKTCANKACGVAQYKSCTSCSGCGYTTKTYTTTRTSKTRITTNCAYPTKSYCPSVSGYSLVSINNFKVKHSSIVSQNCRVYGTCHYKKTVKKCKTCSSSVCGVKSYKSCATSACGSKTCTSSSCCGTTSYCSSSYGSWGGGSTGCSRQSRVIYK